jgi:death on curing protein
MRYLTVREVRALHRQVIAWTGGPAGVRDQGALESAVAQPQMTFSEEDLYPTLVEKAAALGFSLIQNHPFVDGNKRVGHDAMETFLILNGYQIVATVDEQEQIILQVAAGQMKREVFTDWLRIHIEPLR